jgi:hypothetical protein
MKNKIYNYRIILIAVACCFMFSSCLVEDDQLDFGTGTNFVGFSGSTFALNVEADGAAKSSGIPVSIIGPSVANVNNDITVKFEVDPSSTAVEGVNYTLASDTFTLTPQDAVDLYTGMLPITIITDGITPPVDVAPVLNLNILEISGDDNIIINDKTRSVAVTIGYACPFDINNYAGTYVATTDEFGIYIGDTVPFEVVTGPGENQITLVNVAAHPEKYDVVVDVDPASGKLTVAKQPALNYNNFGATQYGEMRWEGSGTSGTSGGFCIGELSIKAAYTVDAGSFGQYKTVFSKTANP